MSQAIGTLVDVKKMFFDRQKVIDATSKADRKALGHIGGTVMNTARNSIKGGKKSKTGVRAKVGISEPGSPPASHTGRLKKGIFYGYDSAHRSVVVGPTVWRTSEPLELLEYGGTTTRKNKMAHYRPRPFMGPAMEKTEPFDRFWKDSVY